MTLLELFALLKKHLKLVIALPIACALATAVFSSGVFTEHLHFYGFYVRAYTRQ